MYERWWWLMMLILLLVVGWYGLFQQNIMEGFWEDWTYQWSPFPDRYPYSTQYTMNNTDGKMYIHGTTYPIWRPGYENVYDFPPGKRWIFYKNYFYPI